MRTLVDFSNLAPTAWVDKLKQLFKLKQIHFVIAKSLLSNQEELCSVTFDLAKYPDFPQKSVSQVFFLNWIL